MSEGYQPIKNNKDVIPPSTSTNVHMRKDGYTWEDVDKAWWEGFDSCKEKVTDKLIKAKKLLKEMIDTPVFNQMGGELYENEEYTELVEEVEKFLKE